MPLAEQLESVNIQALEELRSLKGTDQLEDYYHKYLGKKGSLTELLKGIKDLSIEEKKVTGRRGNDIRRSLEESFKEKQEQIRKQAKLAELEKQSFDILRPLDSSRGALHPISVVQYEAEDIFTAMGFQIMDGPEVETDEYNFGRLNFSDDHPARDMQDTFWLKNGTLLRTHTSSVQIRAMEVLKPPFRIIAPGRVYRFEQTDASHENTFYQLEGMLVDHEVSAANLIYVMKSFLSQFFERDVKVRLRPGYFPFVEPAFELDIQCLVCGGDGCPVCKKSGWVELLPCGLVHANVLKAGGIDPSKWQGFAFGLGLSRLVMMRHQIEDIRHFLSGNLRFLQQF